MDTYGVAKASSFAKASEDTPSGQVGVFDIRHLSTALAYLLFAICHALRAIRV
jgi:hypothetical protein